MESLTISSQSGTAIAQRTIFVAVFCSALFAMSFLTGCEKKTLTPSEENNGGSLYLEASIEGSSFRTVPGEQNAIGTTYYTGSLASPPYWVFELSQPDNTLDEPTLMSFKLAKFDTPSSLSAIDQLKYVIQPGIFSMDQTNPPLNTNNAYAALTLNHPLRGSFSSEFFSIQNLGTLTIKSVREVIVDGLFYIEAEVEFNAVVSTSPIAVPSFDSLNVTNGKGRFTFGGI